MSIKLTWLGHGGWSIKSGPHTILLDPFLSDSPVAPVKADELEADFILVSHGHFDHISDVPAIAQRTGAQVVAVFEISQWLAEKHQLTNVLGMNVGGGASLPFGHVKMTPALHSSELPDGASGGVAAGFVLTFGAQRIYFACDTALFRDMELIGQSGLELAVLPIGDLYTMGPDDAIEAIRLLNPKRVAPAHYNTWPPIEQDAGIWANQVRQHTYSEPMIVEPGGVITI